MKLIREVCGPKLGKMTYELIEPINDGHVTLLRFDAPDANEAVQIAKRWIYGATNSPGVICHGPA